ncbi:WYL domain-containing protein [Anaerocolumna sedimenticola]|uniref:WYL domain-containing protein n=1 Tax=Anaerocolumna sedimenticola TaxID=2696063 RepID=A0A6P1TEH7_9FIRM|nr:YafY family protein [Anaerocolumna sedimenticola]QHQ59640.1 WYL domain-containing protein [Anaerocolumna sedimenticola]
MKIDRLLGIIISLLNKETLTAKQLAEKFEVSIRTIQRDMESISMAGVPIVSNTGSSGGYSILSSYKLENQFIKRDDYKIIIMALKSLNTGYGSRQLEHIIDKYLALNGGYAQNVFLDYSVSREDNKVQENNKLIEHSINDMTQINFDYKNVSGILSHRNVQPLALRFQWYGWYLFGFDLSKRDYRSFKIARMQNLEATDTKFCNDADIEELLRLNDNEYMQTCENIKVWCHKDSISILEEYFPQEERVAFEEGHYIMNLHVPPNERLWQALLLSMGDKVKIIEPEYYRQKLIETASKFLSNYDI